MTFAVVALISVAVAQTPTPASLPGQPCTAAALVGTWTLVEGTVGDQTTPPGPNQPTAYKHITPTHFVVFQVTADGKNTITYAHGGTYTVSGGTYTENIQHGFGDVFQQIAGQSVSFQCSVEGNDRWHISGNVGTTALRETWKRVSAEMKTP